MPLGMFNNEMNEANRILIQADVDNLLGGNIKTAIEMNSEALLLDSKVVCLEYS
jgi:hypothetical protein